MNTREEIIAKMQKSHQKLKYLLDGILAEKHDPKSLGFKQIKQEIDQEYEFLQEGMKQFNKVVKKKFS